MSSILFCTASPLAATVLGDLDAGCIGRDAGCCMLFTGFAADTQQTPQQHCHSSSKSNFFMVALCNRADHYIFILFLSSFFLFFLA